MPVIGIGIDILHLPRFAALLVNRGHTRVARRILSRLELAEWHNLSGTNVERRSHYLSTRWAVKEAAYKALSATARTTWKDWTYRHASKEGLGIPSLVYKPVPQNAVVVDGLKVHVTVSHDGDYVIAQVLAEC